MTRSFERMFISGGLWTRSKTLNRAVVFTLFFMWHVERAFYNRESAWKKFRGASMRRWRERKRVFSSKLNWWPHSFVIFPFHGWILILRCYIATLLLWLCVSYEASSSWSERERFFKPSLKLPLFLSIFLSAVSSAAATAVAFRFSYWNSGFFSYSHSCSCVCECVLLHCLRASSFFRSSIHFACSSLRSFSSCILFFSIGRFDEPLFHCEPFSMAKNLALLE